MNIVLSPKLQAALNSTSKANNLMLIHKERFHARDQTSSKCAFKKKWLTKNVFALNGKVAYDVTLGVKKSG